MSNQDFYNQQQPQGQNQGQGQAQEYGHVPIQSNNPYAQQGQQPQQVGSNPSQYAPPPGPPPRRTDDPTFQETDFVPDSQRGEQREVLEHFEMNRSQPESETDRDVATLQQQFPTVDGALIAAIYGDTNSLSATREMLTELASSES